MARKITGYGSVFYDPKDHISTEYRLEKDVFERLSRHAFDATLRHGQQISCLNHDLNYLLGRTPGTLALSTDSRGLRYEVSLSDSAMSDHVYLAVQRGDLVGSSFAFEPTKQRFHEETRGGKRIIIRTIEEVQLFETGPVSTPAYSGTSVAIM